MKSSSSREVKTLAIPLFSHLSLPRLVGQTHCSHLHRKQIHKPKTNKIQQKRRGNLYLRWLFLVISLVLALLVKHIAHINIKNRHTNRKQTKHKTGKKKKRKENLCLRWLFLLVSLAWVWNTKGEASSPLLSLTSAYCRKLFHKETLLCETSFLHITQVLNTCSVNKQT